MAFEEGENQIKTQKWMEIIENKNQKTFQNHKLAHDLGAGSPCLQCKDDCPGLDLHFWRKVCKNCKCKKEQHDVKEEDDIFSKFEILFGISRCNPSQAILDLKLKFPYELEDGFEDKATIPSSSSKKEYKFDWIPPNISSELAAEYMQHLPASKLPISGSDGALYRRQQLEKQVPMHDLNANLCHNLTSDEIQCLSDYLENLKQNAAGQGKIMKLPNLLNPADLTSSLTHKPNSVPLPPQMSTSFSADAISSIYNTVPKPFKPISGNSNITSYGLDENEFPPPPPELLEDGTTNFSTNLKPPSAFIKKSRSPSPQPPYTSTGAPYLSDSNIQPGINTLTSALYKPIPNMEPHSNLVDENNDDDNKNVKVGDFIKSLNNKMDQQTQTPQNRNNSGGKTNQNMGTGSGAPNHNMSVASGTSNPNLGTGMNLPNEMYYQPRPYESKINSMKIESFNQLNEKINLPNKMIAKNLDNVHKNVSTNTIHSNNSGSDNINNVKVTNLDDLITDMQNSKINEPLYENIPTGGNVNNYGNTMYQHGNEDNNLNNIVSSGHRNTFPSNMNVIDQHGQYITKPNESMMSNKVCKHCKVGIKYGELAIYTEKLGDDVTWHPQCFVCNTCNELLVDLMYFHYKSNVYCLRDYAQMLNIPRCYACDELIFVNEYTLAENKTYHVKHFCCYECDKELCNQSYILVGDQRNILIPDKAGEGDDVVQEDETAKHPHCLDCYYRLFSKKCATCNKVIDVQDKCIHLGNFYWHISNCFSCANCKKHLNNEKFIMQFEKPFCSRQCVLGFSESDQ